MPRAELLTYIPGRDRYAAVLAGLLEFAARAGGRPRAIGPSTPPAPG